MKKTFKLVIAFLCLVAMSGCSNEQTYKERIIGKWQPVDYEYFYNDGSEGDIPQDELEAYLNSITWTFNIDGTIVITKNGNTATLSWLLEDDKIVFSTGHEYIIEKLTSKKMILKCYIGNDYARYARFSFDKVE